MNEPKVLTRMRLSCCWGDNLNEKELNEVVDYISYLQNNWNELKDIVNNTFYKLNGILDRDLLEKQMYIDYGYIRNKMQELENGNNE